MKDNYVHKQESSQRKPLMKNSYSMEKYQDTTSLKEFNQMTNIISYQDVLEVITQLAYTAKSLNSVSVNNANTPIQIMSYTSQGRANASDAMNMAKWIIANLT